MNQEQKTKTSLVSEKKMQSVHVMPPQKNNPKIKEGTGSMTQ